MGGFGPSGVTLPMLLAALLWYTADIYLIRDDALTSLLFAIPQIPVKLSDEPRNMAADTRTTNDSRSVYSVMSWPASSTKNPVSSFFPRLRNVLPVIAIVSAYANAWPTVNANALSAVPQYSLPSGLARSTRSPA